MGRGRLLVLVTILVISSFSGCSVQTEEGIYTNIDVHVVATENFGTKVLLDEVIKVSPETSAMEALHKVVDVETKYGGGFVDAINGVYSQYPVKDDWFFYINGISVNKGADDYTLHDGDTVHFDLHDWHFRMFIPAIIGDFGEPLLHGYGGEARPTVIVYEDGLEEAAGNLERSLKDLGIADVCTQNIDDLMKGDKQHSNLILISTKDCSLASEMNRVWAKLGFFVRFEDDMMITYNSRGEVTAEHGSGSGVIQATQNPWNPKGIGVCENVVWMVSGVDEAGVRNAVGALVNCYSEFQYAFAAVVTDGDVIRVP